MTRRAAEVVQQDRRRRRRAGPAGQLASASRIAAFHLVRRRRIAGADFDLEPRRNRRLRVVEDRLLRDDAVGHDQKLPRLGAQLGRPPRDLLNLPFAIADGDPVADAKRLLDLNRKPREQIAERVLQREADDDGADRRRRQQLLLHQHRGDDREQRR